VLNITLAAKGNTADFSDNRSHDIKEH